jgi:hypothetical protein
VVHDGQELKAALADCLANPLESHARGLRAQKLVLAQQGATARTVERIAGFSCFLPPAGSKAA